MLFTIFLLAPLFPKSASAEEITAPLDNPFALFQVRKYTDYYLVPENTKWLCNVLEEGEIYRLYTRKRLAEEKMPRELEYLPVVESNYKPTASSSSGAKGLWQFMENSISGLLKKDDWVDERLDPFLSTEAAIKKLKDNHNVFHDWLLALAAYNSGAGAVSRILNQIEKTENRNFWYISLTGILRDESTEYVPKLIAIADIVENASKYGIEMPETSEKETFYNEEENLFFEYAETTREIPLSRLASELKMDEDFLEKLNPALVKKSTPPYPYRLRVPSGTNETILSIPELNNLFAFSNK